jgi:hypothetical protein
MTTQEILDLFGVKNGKGHCPAHDDKQASLSINPDSSGRTLVHCFAGCKLDDVLAAKGITQADLFSGKGHGEKRTLITSYPYRDENGSLLYQKRRYDPKAFSFDRKLDGIRPILYRLPELLAAELTTTVFIVEGEKDTDKLAMRGFIATTSPFGGSKTPSAKRWRPEWNELFRNRTVVVIAHNDETGIGFAWYIASELVSVAADVRVIEVLPGVTNKGGDVSNFFEQGGTREQLLDLVAKTPKQNELSIQLRRDQQKAAANSATRTAAAMGAAPQKKSQADLLVELATADAELFHDDDTAFATIDVGDHKETHAIASRRFRLYVLRLYHETHGKAPDETALRSAINVLCGKALFDGSEIRVHVRIAALNRSIYLDLADELWRAVEIDPKGWRIADGDALPVKFRRPRGMLPLPEPKSGGSVNEFRRFLNVDNDDDFTMAVGWLLGTFRGRGPYPILVQHGEQGCGKSECTWVCRSLIDPNVASLRRKPRDEQDLMIGANNGHVMAFDNLSSLTVWLSDALCVLATGGGLGKRELYSDAEEVILDAVRPIVLNGIEELATRGDLLDRSIICYLPEIPDEERLPREKFRAEFEAARPRILGAFLDAVSTALRRESSVKLDRLPRMADFALWVTAAEPAFGWKQGRFLEAYARNRDDASALAIEASVVAGEVQKLALPWEGGAKELLQKLNDQASKETKQHRAWPADETRLSGALRRIAPPLRDLGIMIEFLPRQEFRRPIRISAAASSEAGKAASAASSPDAPDAEKDHLGDEDWGEA